MADRLVSITGFATKVVVMCELKAPPPLRTIPKALDTGNLEVVPFARVTEIMTNDAGKVTGVSLCERIRVIYTARFCCAGSKLHL